MFISANLKNGIGFRLLNWEKLLMVAIVSMGMTVNPTGPVIHQMGCNDKDHSKR